MVKNIYNVLVGGEKGENLNMLLSLEGDNDDTNV